MKVYHRHLDTVRMDRMVMEGMDLSILQVQQLEINNDALVRYLSNIRKPFKRNILTRYLVAAIKWVPCVSCFTRAYRTMIYDLTIGISSTNTFAWILTLMTYTSLILRAL